MILRRLGGRRMEMEIGVWVIGWVNWLKGLKERRKGSEGRNRR